MSGRKGLRASNDVDPAQTVRAVLRLGHRKPDCKDKRHRSRGVGSVGRVCGGCAGPRREAGDKEKRKVISDSPALESSISRQE